MKIRLIIILAFILTTIVNAQNFKHFDIDTTSDSKFGITLIPKGKYINLDEIPHSRFEFTYNDSFMNQVYEMLSNSFRNIDEETKKALKRTDIIFYFDKDFKIYYYDCLLPKDYVGKMEEMEDNWYKFVTEFSTINLSPFITVKDKASFAGSRIMFRTIIFLNYEANKAKGIPFEKQTYQM